MIVKVLVIILIYNLKQHVVTQFGDNKSHLPRLQLQLVMMTVMMPVVLMMTTMVTVTMTMMVMVMVINLKQHVVSQFRDNEPHLARLEVEQGGFVADLNFRILFMICFNGKRRTWPNKGGRLASRPWILNLVPQMFDVISTIRP